MQYFEAAKQKAVEALGLPRDAMLGMARISIEGGRVALIENHRGIIEYSRAVVRFATQGGEVNVSGQDLTLMRLTREDVLITGQIASISIGQGQ